VLTLKNLEKIRINYEDDNVKGLVIANEKLKSHAQIHDENRSKFKCSHCDKQFLYKTNLAVHIR